jgi:acetyltransferase-like isoleucine patch superfamily enzyme
MTFDFLLTTAAARKVEMRAMLERLCWLFLPPSRLKNAILRRFGHQISDTAIIGPTVVLGVKKFEIGDNARMSLFNVFKDMGLVRLDDNAVIESWNWVSAAPEFQDIDPKAGTLHVQYAAKIGSRNYLDCSGTIILRPYCFVGGNRVFLQSHEPDFQLDRQMVGRIVVGHHALVHSCSVLLMGSVVPDQSVLAPNSTMRAPKPDDDMRRGVYSGSPAKWVGETEGVWFERTSLVMKGTIVQGPMGPAPFDPGAFDPALNGGQR